MSQRRVYLEYIPSSASRQALLELQAGLTQPGDKLVPPNELHLTLLHIGKFDKFLADLRRANPELSADTVNAALTRFIAATEPLLPRIASFTPTGITSFGSQQQLLVLTGEVDAALQQAHAACLAHLHELLNTCSVDDTAEFMTSSPNLRHALSLKPHISLLRQTTDAARTLPSVLPEIIQLQAVDPELDLRSQTA